MAKNAQISNEQMIISIQELKDKGFSYYKINQMVAQGTLIKLNKKYYENANFDGEECICICTRRSCVSTECSCVL